MAKKKRRKGSSENKHGYDYAFLPISLAIGSLDFAKLLTEANIIAVAYGLDYSDIIGVRIPTITLVGRNSGPLRKVFQQFAKWSESSDGDAVELTIVFKNDGGYLLGLSPDSQRLKQRCLGFDRVSKPILTSITWIKTLDTTSPGVRELQNYCKRLVSPFFLEAAYYKGLTVGSTPDLSLLEQIAGIDKILKFTATFVDEDHVQENSQAWLVLNIHRSKIEKSKLAKLKKKLIGKDLANSHTVRMEGIKEHFSVTLERIKSHKDLTAIKNRLETQGIRSWQIDQAICNLLLSIEITKGKLYFESISEQKLDEVVCSALRNRFEIADGNLEHLKMLTDDIVITQVILDSITLLRRTGIQPNKKDLASLLEQLNNKGLLNS